LATKTAFLSFRFYRLSRFHSLIISAMSSSSESERPTPPKRKNHDLKFKLEIVEYAENYSKRGAATNFKVDPASVRD
jgi:hypothetical protein